MKFLQPDGWKPAKGYANGVLAEGRMIFVGGQIGWTKDQVFQTGDFVGQCEQALRNIVDVLAEADAGPQHIVRMTWFITDRQQCLARQQELGEAYKRVIGRHFPAMSMVQVTALMEDAAQVEIEATAVLEP